MENKRTFIPTTEVINVENYPYGFKLRTTLFDSVEFNPKKGYRHITQTINPKNGRLNAPKKSTYKDFLIRFYNENNHIKTLSLDFNVSLDKFKELGNKISFYWKYLSIEERSYIISKFKEYTKVAAYCSIVHGGANKDNVSKISKDIHSYLNSFANIKEKKVKGEIKKVIISYNVDSDIFTNFPNIDTELLKDENPDQPKFVSKKYEVL